MNRLIRAITAIIEGFGIIVLSVFSIVLSGFAAYLADQYFGNAYVDFIAFFGVFAVMAYTVWDFATISMRDDVWRAENKVKSSYVEGYTQGKFDFHAELLYEGKNAEEITKSAHELAEKARKEYGKNDQR